MKYLERKTKRLHIRPMKSKDFKAWEKAHLSMGKCKNEWDLGPQSQEDLSPPQFKRILAGQLERRKKDVFYDLGVFEADGSLVGNVSIMEVVRGISHTAYLGYRIFNPYWRKGYGKEAVQAMLDIGFEDIALHRIEAGIDPRNIRSIQLAKSLGMRREGLKRRALFLRNRWVDIIMFTLTTEDVGRKFDLSKLRYERRS